MKHFSPRYGGPIVQTRPKGARLLEGFSQKLQRRLQLFDYASFSVWIGLEADPAVRSFCERPTRSNAFGKDRVIDFWVGHSSGDESFYVLDADDGGERPITLHDTTVHYVDDAQLAADAMWVTNWRSMLAVINASTGGSEKTMSKSVREFVQGPIALGRLEAEFSCGDPMVARACIFELLRQGKLAAPSLRTQALTLFTPIEPTC